MPQVHKAQLPKLSESLSKLRLCSPRALEQMERSLQRLGQLSAVLTYRGSDGLEVIDGFKRVRAARTLRWMTIWTQVVDVDPAGAKLRMLRSNESCVMSAVEEAWVIRSLHREDELTQPAIARLFGRHKSWVNRRLLLAEGLCDEVQADLRLGLVSMTVAREVARLPRGNQRELAKVAVQRGLTTRQTARLVDQWISAPDAKGRARVLAEVEVATTNSSSKPERTSSAWTPGERIAADVDALQNRSVRLQVRLLERPLSSLGGEAAELCRTRLSELRGVLATLNKTIDRVTSEGRDGRA